MEFPLFKFLLIRFKDSIMYRLKILSIFLYVKIGEHFS